METFKFSRDIAQLAILQRIELSGSVLKKIRKLFGRYLFTNFFSKYLISVPIISDKYYNLMNKEYLLIEKFLKPNQDILSIGSGIGGLEILIKKRIKNNKISFIEKNYISKKIKYGWDDKNKEGYNSLYLLEKFLIKNGIEKNSFDIYDFDEGNFPDKKFDLILSIYSLDYHYNFEIYFDYFKQVSNDSTIIIFDTIRPEYFKNIFREVSVIKEDNDTLHKSKRIACRILLR